MALGWWASTSALARQAGIGRSSYARELGFDEPIPVAGEAPPLGRLTPTTVTTKTCPMCAEDVKVAARICRFCRYEFPPDPGSADG
jgi:hypothetical protein